MSSLKPIRRFAVKYILTTRAFTDSDSLLHLNDAETVDDTDDGSGDGDEESDGGVGLGD